MTAETKIYRYRVVIDDTSFMLLECAGWNVGQTGRLVVLDANEQTIALFNTWKYIIKDPLDE